MVAGQERRYVSIAISTPAIMQMPAFNLDLNTYLVSEPMWLAYLTYLVQLSC